MSDATGLLKAWLNSGERTAVSITPYFAPDTRPAALAAAEAAARASGVKTVFTLASALLPSEAFVSGLPHGLYASGDGLSEVVLIGGQVLAVEQVAARSPNWSARRGAERGQRGSLQCPGRRVEARATSAAWMAGLSYPISSGNRSRSPRNA
ncbi:MAG: hypothetical protein WCC48_10740 [Anaeromyxobacteraceae bacterium]